MDNSDLAMSRDLVITALLVAILGTAFMAAGVFCDAANICTASQANTMLGFGVLAGVYSAITALSFARLSSIATSGIALTIVSGLVVLV